MLIQNLTKGTIIKVRDDAGAPFGHTGYWSIGKFRLSTKFSKSLAHHRKTIKYVVKNWFQEGKDTWTSSEICERGYLCERCKREVGKEIFERKFKTKALECHVAKNPWGFGWVDKAQCFRSARRFGAAGSSPDFSRGFSRHGAPRPLSWTFFQCTLLSYPGQPSYSHAFRWASDLAKFYQDWGPDLCESRWRAHSLIGVSFECPYQYPPWSPVSIGKPAPKIHQWTIYFCRWGFGWVDKAQCFRSARRFGAAGSSPDFSRGFSRHGAPRPLSWTFFQCTLLSYPGQPSYSHAFRWASDLAKFYQDWGPDLCESRWRAHSLIGVSFECPYQYPPWSPVPIGKSAPKIHQWTVYFCRWGFGWVDKAQCFRSARRFGAAGSSPDFSRGFSRHGAPRPLSWTFFQCTLLSYPGQPSYSQRNLHRRGWGRGWGGGLKTRPQVTIGTPYVNHVIASGNNKWRWW